MIARQSVVANVGVKEKISVEKHLSNQSLAPH